MNYSLFNFEQMLRMSASILLARLIQ